MTKCLLKFFVLLLPFFLFKATILARQLGPNLTPSFVTIINPVRGPDFWPLASQSPIDFPSFQKQTHQENNLPATWLLRPDFLFQEESDSFFKDPAFSEDEIGIFLELTPTWAERAGVKYQEEPGWWFAKNVFLSGYNPQDRLKLVDRAFSQYYQIFKKYPQTVGAWHLDPETVSYLQREYQISAILICADQFSTDTYQIWGAWWGVPYYPQKKNLLLPANKNENKLDLVTLWWAARDPLNAYGPSVDQSTYSVQPNDYFFHGLDITYFSSLADFYLSPQEAKFGQLTIGLENDNSLVKYSSEYEKQIKTLLEKDPQFLTASQFASWYKKSFPDFSPPHQIGGLDLLGTGIKSFWEMTPTSRTFSVLGPNQKLEVLDQRSYDQNYPDPYLKNRNNSQNLYWNIPAQIDSINPLHPQNLSSDLLNISFPYLSVAILFLSFFFLSRKLKIPTSSILFISFLSLIFVLPMIRSGLTRDYGLGLWGPNGHDGIWHLSLIEQLKTTPLFPDNPIFAGEKLLNYHYGFNLLSALFLKAIPLNSIQFYFQLFPLFLALALGILSYLFARKNSNHRSALLFVFLNYFAGSFGWIITLLRDRSWGGESLFWSMQSISTLLNPPYALSLLFILLGLIFWQNLRKKSKTSTAVFLGVFFALLSAIKVYAAILLGLAIFFFWFIKLLKKEAKKFDLFLWLSMALASFLILYYFGIFSTKSGLIFKPFWFIHSLIESLDKLYLPGLAVLRQNLSAQLLSWKLPFLLALEFILVLIFFLGNLGTRIFALLPILRKKKKKDLDLILLLICFFAFLLPLLFVQAGTTWNTIQFFYYLLFIFNLYFAIFLSDLIRKRHLLFFFLLILLTLPTSFSTLKDYLGNPAPAAVAHYELEALSFLKDQPRGIILTYPWDQHRKQNQQTPIPLRYYETSAYVSALSTQPVFLEDEMNLNITGYPWPERKLLLNQFFKKELDPYQSRGLLINNNISYIYLLAPDSLPYLENDLGIKKIFSNGNATIYQVLK